MKVFSIICIVIGVLGCIGMLASPHPNFTGPVMWLVLGFVLLHIHAKRSVGKNGFMRIKYAKLLEHILKGHKGTKVFYESSTTLVAGAENYAGSTKFYLIQLDENRLKVEYEVKNNPIVNDFRLSWVFPDNKDQDEMMMEIVQGIMKYNRDLVGL